MTYCGCCCRADKIAKLTNHISIRVTERARPLAASNDDKGLKPVAKKVAKKSESSAATKGKPSAAEKGQPNAARK